MHVYLLFVVYLKIHNHINIPIDFFWRTLWRVKNPHFSVYKNTISFEFLVAFMWSLEFVEGNAVIFFPCNSMNLWTTWSCLECLDLLVPIHWSCRLRWIDFFFRQITASVAFLPLLEQRCSFDVLIYAGKDTDTPADWTESGACNIENGQHVQLRSFSTAVHTVHTKVSYKPDV